MCSFFRPPTDLQFDYICVGITNFSYSSISEENFNCKNVKTLCNEMADDYNTAKDFSKEYLNRILFLRYETLAYHPFATLDVLYAFLNLEPEPKLDEYLTSRTGVFR